MPERGQNFKFWSDQLIGIKTRASEFFVNLGLQNVFNRTFKSIDKFQNGVAIVQYEGKYGIINRQGMFVVPPKFDAIKREKEGHFKVQSSNIFYGLWSSNGKEIVPAKYDTMEYLNNEIIKVENADFIGYYRVNGEPLWENR